MSRSIGNIGFQRVGLIERSQHYLCNLLHALFHPTADIILFSMFTTAVEDQWLDSDLQPPTIPACFGYFGKESTAGYKLPWW